MAFLQDFLTKKRWKKDTFPSGFVADLLTLRQAILLCKTCEQRLGRRFARQYEYQPLHRFGAAGDCEYCQQFCADATLWLPEEGATYQREQQFQRLRRDPGTVII